MSQFQRYAVYYLPDDPAFAGFGASWLGWDVVRGAPARQPETAIDLENLTAMPRKYGFHATLKAPFQLADGKAEAALFDAVAELAASAPPIEVAALEVRSIGRFLAFVPANGKRALDDLAGRIVTELDRFRAPPKPEDLARRRAAGLTQDQEAMLTRWGYPYVLGEFRFHLTLTGPADANARRAARNEAERLMPPLPRPFPIRSISIAGEREDGMFVALRRYPLGG